MGISLKNLSPNSLRYPRSRFGLNKLFSHRSLQISLLKVSELVFFRFWVSSHTDHSIEDVTNRWPFIIISSVHLVRQGQILWQWVVVNLSPASCGDPQPPVARFSQKWRWISWNEIRWRSWHDKIICPHFRGKSELSVEWELVIDKERQEEKLFKNKLTQRSKRKWLTAEREWSRCGVNWTNFDTLNRIIGWILDRVPAWFPKESGLLNLTRWIPGRLEVWLFSSKAEVSVGNVAGVGIFRKQPHAWSLSKVSLVTYFIAYVSVCSKLKSVGAM